MGIETKTGKKWLSEFEGSRKRMEERIAQIESEARAAQLPAHDLYTVRPGDSLWSIAQRFYNDGNRWHEIHEANRALIGDNANLIHPGQRLVIPQ